MHPAVNKLTAPGQRRPSIMKGGILQIMVTRACDKACFGCTQGSNLGGKPAVMTPDQFDQAVASLEGYFGVIACFGGNPCMSPHFEDYCRILRARVPFEQRGIWTNNLMGKGAVARITFNPRHSNLNVHLDSDAAGEMRRDWPESAGYIKGTLEDSMHGTPWVSPTDLGIPEERRWDMIAGCDISKYWSSLIGVVRGELRAFFCEVAYAMAALHQDNPDWSGTGQPMPDVGLPVTPGWWRKPMAEFEQQVLACCHHCAIPLRRQGQLAIGGDHEEFSLTHQFIARPKARSRVIEMVTIGGIMDRTDRPSTEYLPGTTPKVRSC